MDVKSSHIVAGSRCCRLVNYNRNRLADSNATFVTCFFCMFLSIYLQGDDAGWSSNMFCLIQTFVWENNKIAFGDTHVFVRLF